MPKFEVSGKDFIYDGKPERIISGTIHYFRVVPEYWKDRLLKMKACGFNTVETYVAWNIHEPKPEEFCFEGMGDICKFIQTAGEVGLHVIVRPGPYICAEWEFGGLPAWLMTVPGIKLRCYNKPFIDRVDAFYDVLLPKLKPLLCTNGGPIIAMQVENEYGSYGNDKKYLNHLKEGMIKRGIDVFLFTSDGSDDLMLEGGTLPGVLKTVNFGSRPEEAFKKLSEYQNNKPLMCMEFWNGWFDHWGEKHHTRPTGDVADVFERMLKMGASVNLYMFHGGTNFGFMNGANYSDKLYPTVTSYDYDSPLNEAGDATEKYFVIRDIISKYKKIDDNYIPKPSKKKTYGRIELTQQAGLFEVLDTISKPVKSAHTQPMEMLGQNYGFILYRTHITGPKKGSQISIIDVHDRAQVFLGGKFMGIIERDNKEGLTVDIPEGDTVLDILVENMGRINYGPELGEFKGITKGVRLDYQFIFDWDIYTLPLDNIEKLQFSKVKTKTGPIFCKGTFKIDELADTFITLEGWNKGVVFINGFNLGRYWNEVGPQKTLYIPAPLLHKGENEIVVFELHEMKEPIVELMDKPMLG